MEAYSPATTRLTTTIIVGQKCKDIEAEWVVAPSRPLGNPYKNTAMGPQDGFSADRRFGEKITAPSFVMKRMEISNGDFTM